MDEIEGGGCDRITKVRKKYPCEEEEPLQGESVNIWIIQTGEPLHCDGGSWRPMRAMNLADEMWNRGHIVRIVSSRFFHQEKRKRSTTRSRINVSERLEIDLVDSPGYKKNLSLERFYDHFVLAVNLARWLVARRKEKPDIVWIGYPPIETAFVTVIWCKVYGVKCVLDVKDLWPDLFLDAVGSKLRRLTRIILFPFFRASRICYSKADSISSMSDAYLRRVLELGRRCQTDDDMVNPLAPREVSFSELDLNLAREWWRKRGLSFDGRFTIIFVGSMMSVFDFDPVTRCIEEFEKAGYKCQFVLCGDGEYLPTLKEKVEKCKNCIVPGWIDYPQLSVLAEVASAALLPYKNIENFQLNIPNKAVDAMRFGLPILTPLQGKLSSMIDRHKVGWVYSEDGECSLSKITGELMNDIDALRRASEKAKELYDNEYRYSVVYARAAEKLEELSSKRVGRQNGAERQTYRPKCHNDEEG